MAHLHFLSGPLAGKRANLNGSRISLGRAPGNSIRIDDDSIAPRHFVLIRDVDEYSLYIDASKPPVAINGKQVVNETLKNGDLLQIGAIRARFSNKLARTAPPNPLDFTALSMIAPAPEILSLDDAEELPLEDEELRAPGGRAMRILLALGVLMLMMGGSLIVFRKDMWKEPPRPADAARNQEDDQAAPQDEPNETSVPKIDKQPRPDEPKNENQPRLEALPIGAGASGLRAEGKIRRTKDFPSHQEAVGAAQPGDAVIFDSIDAKPVVVTKPLRDVQFISGSASWELHADLIDCQFISHETKQIIQQAGKLERCVFFRCPMKQTHLIHADAVSFYFDERSPLHPKDNPDQGKSPILLLSGFVRDVLILKPFSGSPTADKRFDMRWGPSIRIHATDPMGDGRGTYILSPVVFGQRAWTPHEITRGNGITYAHLTTDNNAWANPVLEILRGNDCVVLCTSLGSEIATTAEQYSLPPRKLKYHDHEEFGYDNGPAFRGAAMLITGLHNRIVAHGDARKPWTVGRKSGLPGLHYADGIVADDPAIMQFASEQGGLSVNFAEMTGAFAMQPVKDGAEFLSQPRQPDGAPLYPRSGPELHQPVFVPLKDLRLNAGTFDKLPLQDLTGKSIAEIEKALVADKSIFLGPGTYEFKQTIKAGFVAGAGMDKTILKWPEGIDCSQRNCRGLINCTVSGGRFGFNSQAGLAGRLGNPNGLFVRTRFTGQKEAGVNLHSSSFQTWQDCEFVGCKIGFAHGLDKSAGVFKGDKGAAGGITIDNLNLCNCTFRDIAQRAIDLAPDAPKLGHVGIHNCSFEKIGDAAIRIEGGQTHLVQHCRVRYAGRQSYSPAISIVSHGVVALSHIDLDCTGVKGNPVCVTLKGTAAVSHCTIKGMPTSLKCEGLLAADNVIGDGNVDANKDSLLCQCRFKNMDLPDGTALAKEKTFTDVTAMTLRPILDKAPPPPVNSHRARTVNKQRHVEWKPVVGSELGIAFYIILSERKEVGRGPFQYEPPSDYHSPLLPLAAQTSFTDPNPDNRDYDVLAVNGGGITSEGREALPRRLGPARARFLAKDGNPIDIKDFTNLKGKVTQVVDVAGNKYPLAKVGNDGMPSLIYFEPGDLVETP